jgi:hypothetical protein
MNLTTIGRWDKTVRGPGKTSAEECRPFRAGVSGIFGLASVGDTLYGLSGTSTYTIDVTNGAASVVLGDGSHGLGDAFGAAFGGEAGFGGEGRGVSISLPRAAGAGLVAAAVAGGAPALGRWRSCRKGAKTWETTVSRSKVPGAFPDSDVLRTASCGMCHRGHRGHGGHGGHGGKTLLSFFSVTSAASAASVANA